MVKQSERKEKTCLWQSARPQSRWSRFQTHLASLTAKITFLRVVGTVPGGSLENKQVFPYVSREM